MRYCKLLLLVAISCALFGAGTRAKAEILYEVTPDFTARQYDVTVTVPHPPDGALRVQIPTWSPGAYIVGDYASRISDVEVATESGTPLTVTHPDRLTWEVAPSRSGPIRVSYKVGEVDIESAGGTPKRAHLSGPRTYMYVVGRKTERTRLVLHTPSTFKVACSLDPGEVPGTFTAPTYDVLADAPIEMGDYPEDNFEVRSVAHKIVLYGDYSAVDRNKLKEYCQRIAQEEIGFFNDAPFKRYVFEFRCFPTGQGGGGLEHLGSTEITIMGPVTDRTRSVIAHEYFHAWNVKRIRPFVLGPFDYTGPVRTHNLWWSEGVTSYYGDLLSERAKLDTPDEYLKHLGDTIGQLQSNPARLKVTADDSSYRVWDGGGSQGYGRLSYYTKGELIGLCLDMKIREATHDRRSLDDVMRSLYRQVNRGNGPGFGEDAIRTTIDQVAGQNLDAFYDQLARSTDEMPFAECLGYAGLTVGPAEKPNILPDPGMFTRAAPDGRGLMVFRVSEGGAAAEAGIKEGDRITAIDGQPATASLSATGLVKAGAKMKLTVERNGTSMDLDYTVGSREVRPWVISRVPNSTPEQLRIREGWLKG